MKINNDDDNDDDSGSQLSTDFWIDKIEFFFLYEEKKKMRDLFER